jgi:hypothetical protein
MRKGDADDLYNKNIFVIVPEATTLIVYFYF